MVFGWLRIDFDGLGSMFGLFLDGLFDVVGKTFDVRSLDVDGF